MRVHTHRHAFRTHRRHRRCRRRTPPVNYTADDHESACTHTHTLTHAVRMHSNGSNAASLRKCILHIHSHARTHSGRSMGARYQICLLALASWCVRAYACACACAYMRRLCACVRACPAIITNQWGARDCVCICCVRAGVFLCVLRVSCIRWRLAALVT